MKMVATPAPRAAEESRECEFRAQMEHPEKETHFISHLVTDGRMLRREEESGGCLLAGKFFSLHVIEMGS